MSNLLEFDPYIFVMENGKIISSGSQEQLKDDLHFNILLTGNNKVWLNSYCLQETEGKNPC